MGSKEEVIKLKEWLSQDTIDDPEDLFQEIPLIIELINFWLEANSGK